MRPKFVELRSTRLLAGFAVVADRREARRPDADGEGDAEEGGPVGTHVPNEGADGERVEGGGGAARFRTLAVRATIRGRGDGDRVGDGGGGGGRLRARVIGPVDGPAAGGATGAAISFAFFLIPPLPSASPEASRAARPLPIAICLAAVCSHFSFRSLHLLHAPPLRVKAHNKSAFLQFLHYADIVRITRK